MLAGQCSKWASSLEVGREGGQGFKKVMVSRVLVLSGRTGLAKWVGYFLAHDF